MVKFTRAIIGFSLAVLSAINPVHAQCPDADFSITQPVCPQQNLTITNNSTGAVTYDWDFCAGDFETGLYTKWDTSTSQVTSTVAVSVIDGADHYGFLAGRDNNDLIRLEFGNSFSNTPSLFDLGNPLNAISAPAGLVFRQEGGIWYAIMLNLNLNSAVLFTFGNGLDTIPTGATPITINGLNGPRAIDLTVESGHLIAAIMNNADDKLIIADFGASITNLTPLTNAYTVTGANLGWGVSIARICNASYVFVSNYGGSNLIRIDFTNSLQSAPTAVTTLNVTIFNPAGISVITDNGKWLLLVSGWSPGQIAVYNLDTVITNNDPTLRATYTPGTTLSGITTIKENSNWYVSVADYTGSKFVTLTPLASCSVNQTTSTDPVPSNIMYNLDGTYHIALTATDANGNISVFGDSVVIAAAPVVNFSFENLCEGDVVQFTDSSTVSGGTITNYLWDFGDSDTSTAINPTHQYAGVNTYTVTLTLTASSGCSTTLSQTVNITARPVANFNLPVGCSDIIMNFTDTSSISSGSITNWLWTFGNGDTLTDQNPVYAFPDGGNFDITLQVTSDAGCTDDTTYTLVISPSPDAGFTIDNTCVGQSVIFTDTTVSQSLVTSYDWDFGDANTSNVASPTHTYATGVPVTYNVSFIVQTQNGCSDTVILPVHISNPPIADFDFVPSTVCENNAIAFSSLLSQGVGDTISAWSWDFGDGFTDSAGNPQHVFTLPDSLSSDTFQVTLIVYSPSNCPSVPNTQDIIVNAGANVTMGYNEVCLGVTNDFADLTAGTITDRLWLFDGVDSSTQMNPSYLFLTPGVHEVTLTVTTDLGCISTDTITLRVHDNPHVAFSYINACTDFPTIFTNNTTLDSLAYVNVYQWNFGDPGDTANTSGLQNPSHVYDSAVVGFHNVTLLVIDNFNCRDSILQTLDVNFSVIPRFAYTPTCLGDIMSFTNLSGNANLDSTWTWNFGDQQTISIENPAHYYVYAGTYTVTLTAMSVDGCLSTASKEVDVSAIPVADFASPPACIHNPYQLLDNSTVSNGSINKWKWTFDTLGTDTVKNPVFTFDTTGTYSVNLIVYSVIGCVDSVRKNVTVHPLPVPNFSYSPQYGNPPLDVAFSNLTNITSTYTWDFGDGSQGSTLDTPHHVYQDTGRFVIELIATSSFGCVDSITKGIYVIQPLLDAAVTNVSATLVNGQLSIQANIANLGTVDIDSVIMQAQLPDGTVIQETYHQLLPNGSNGIQSYNFVASFNTSSTSNVSFYCVSVIKPNGQDDDVESNNEKCSSLNNEFSIMEPYPNPFADMLQIKIILPYDDYLTVEAFSLLGQKITTLFDGMGKTGLNAIDEDFSSLADGVYVIRYSFRDKDIVRRVVKQSRKK